MSYEFFADIFNKQLDRVKSSRKTFRGHFIYAVDGSDLDIPASKSILKDGYRGSCWSKEFETYYPKMHVVHAYDVMNNLVSHFAFSHRAQERLMARDFVAKFERNSIAIYDRLYANQPVFESHQSAGNYFLIRARSTGAHLPKCIQEFITSEKCDSEALWKSQHQPGPGAKVRLVRVTHPKTKLKDIFVTNIPQSLCTRFDLQELYCKRWRIETSFKDLVSTMKMDQWHSQSKNGILQEIYCLLWLVNSIKSQLMIWNDPEKEFFDRGYQKSNLKLSIRIFIDNLPLILGRNRGKLYDLLELWHRRSRENRRHYSRSYPRAVRSYGTGFNVINKVPRRA